MNQKSITEEKVNKIDYLGSNKESKQEKTYDKQQAQGKFYDEERKYKFKSVSGIETTTKSYDSSLESIQITPVYNVPLIQGFDSKNSSIYVILQCFCHFPEFREIISDLNEISKVNQQFKYIMQSLITKSLNDSSLKEFISLLPSISCFSTSCKIDPKEFYSLMIDRLKSKDSKVTVNRTCVFRNIAYIPTITSVNGLYPSECTWNTISILVTNNNWEDSLDTYFRKRVTHGEMQYPRIMAIHLNELIEVVLGKEINIRNTNSNILRYQAELIISREKENYWLTCLEEGQFIRYSSAETLQVKSPLCQKVYMVFFKSIDQID